MKACFETQENRTNVFKLEENIMTFDKKVKLVEIEQNYRTNEVKLRQYMNYGRIKECEQALRLEKKNSLDFWM